MACRDDNRGTERDRAILQERLPNPGDVWFASTSFPSDYPLILGEILGKLQAKGFAVEQEQLRHITFLVQSLRKVPFLATWKLNAKYLSSPEYDKALELGVERGHIQFSGSPGMVAGAPGGLKNALIFMGG